MAMTGHHFRQVYLEITNVCNLGCAFCPGTSRRPEFIAPERFAAILAQVKPLTQQVYLHVMGEPLLHPDFARIVGIAAEQQVPVAVTTNGSLLASPAADSLLAPIVRQINISLQALSRDNAARLQEIIAFVNNALVRRPDLYLNLRLWNLNRAADSLDSIHNQWLAGEIAAAFELDPKAIRPVAGRKSRRLKGRLYLNLDTVFEWPQIIPDQPGKTRGFCHALTGQVAILVDGTVVPCCLDRDGVTALGNCLETPLAEILEQPRTVAMREGFARGRLVEPLCRHCSFCSRFDDRLTPGSNRAAQ